MSITNQDQANIVDKSRPSSEDSLFLRILKAFFVALLVPVTFSCAVLTIFLSNASEITGSFSTLSLSLAILIGVVTLVLLSIQAPFLFIKKHWLVTINSVLFAVGVLLWLQSNAFTWNFGELDGSGIAWESFRHLAVLEVLCYILVFSVIVWKRKIFFSYTTQFACILMMVQFVSLFSPIYRVSVSSTPPPVQVDEQVDETDAPEMTESEKTTPPVSDGPNPSSWKQYEITYDGVFDYSDGSNGPDVIILVLDGFGRKLFDKMSETDPMMVDMFRDFTYFSNTLCDKPGTVYNVPQIQTGFTWPRKKTGDTDYYNRCFAEAYENPHALFKAMTRNGYECTVYTWAPVAMDFDSRWISNIRRVGETSETGMKASRSRERWMQIASCFELSLLRCAPTFVKPLCYGRLGHFESWVASLYPVEQYASITPRMQWCDVDFFEQMRQLEWKNKESIKQLKYIHLQGPHFFYKMNENAERETHSSHESEVRQAWGSLKITREYLDKLKEKGAYDNSLIVIMADHGTVYASQETTMDKTSVKKPILMVKRPGARQEKMRYDDAPLHIKDTTPAILVETNIKDRPADAFSWFSVPKDIREGRKKYWGTQFRDSLEAVALEKKEWTLPPETTIPTKHVRFQKGTLRIELASDKTDAIASNSSNRLVYGLARRENNRELYVTPLPYELLRSRKSSLAFWCSASLIDTTGVPDGEYDLLVFVTQKNKPVHYARIGQCVSVSKGIAAKSGGTAMVAREKEPVVK